LFISLPVFRLVEIVKDSNLEDQLRNGLKDHLTDGSEAPESCNLRLLHLKAVLEDLVFEMFKNIDSDFWSRPTPVKEELNNDEEDLEADTEDIDDVH
jgi:hypothetical protein